MPALGPDAGRLSAAVRAPEAVPRLVAVQTLEAALPRAWAEAAHSSAPDDPKP